MIIDCFTFNNELSILEARLEELDGLVDFHVLVEATKTQSLQDKPMHFEENKMRFKKFLKKIIHVKVVKIPETNGVWSFENYQRNCIASGLFHLRISDKDIILISDVDEIPSKAALEQNLPNLKDFQIYKMGYNVYYLNLQVKDKPWNGTVAVFGSQIQNHSIQTLIKVRDTIAECYKISDGGWHLGYQGGPEFMYKKYFDCVEPFDKVNGIPAKEKFMQLFAERAVDNGSFIFSDNLSRTDLTLVQVPRETLPKFIQENPEKYPYIL
jgi:hypothetical protein